MINRTTIRALLVAVVLVDLAAAAVQIVKGYPVMAGVLIATAVIVPVISYRAWR